jgi:hypothetical protein
VIKLSTLVSIEQFLFGTPLYVELSLPADMKLKGVLAGFYSQKTDGHCPSCKKETTYSVTGTTGFSPVTPENKRIEILEGKIGYYVVSAVCARQPDHQISCWFRLRKSSVLKVGQFPSLADIANDEATSYRSILNKEDAGELHKAIGLAAHGVGIGSFVYLRRVFERLIWNRFNEFKLAEGWIETDFVSMRMVEKIEYLKSHIPTFLYENKQIYGILSKGIHELSEAECLEAFEYLQLSLKIILEEDLKKKEELELKRKASEAIAKLARPPS